MASNLTPAFGAGTRALTPKRRDFARLERATTQEIALVQSRALVAAERGRANAGAVESVAIDAMQAGTQVARHASILAGSCPVAEPMLRMVVEQTGLALGQIVSDTARDLR